ncbi:MAG TPA: NPCBM/NEW2 domain-containing protein, partial [Armatimonadota bacterium]|nr:NPCBM/NEW2 domain-containing protein [Armatimonadota bacterium]
MSESGEKESLSIRKYLSVSAMMIAAVLLATQVSAQDINVLRGSKLPDHAMWLDTLDLSKISQGWCLAHAGKSVMGNPITIKSIVYERGIGTHTESRIEVDLKGAALKFESVIGLDDEERGKGTASFEVFVDGVEKFDSGLMKAGEEKLVSIDITGAKHMRLNVKDGGDGIINDHADWAGAMLVLDPNAKQQPVMSTIPVEPAIPMASGVSPKPAIHGPRIVGTTPGRDFIFLIPATGDGPLTFEAKDLPAGLKLDSNTGIISGSLQKEGEHIVELTVKGARGV